MHYIFETPQLPEKTVEILHYYLPNQTGYYLIGTAAALFPLIHLKCSEKKKGLFILLNSILAYLGFFILLQRPIDEVFINLEHPYNLLHNGLFSFSPTEAIGGTVEILYYFLHTPFAFNRVSLVLGNQLLGFLCGLTILVNLWWSMKRSNMLKHVLLLFFAAYIPFIELFSNGFGSALVGALMGNILIWQILGPAEKAKLLIPILSLVRPDGLIYSGIFCLGEWIKNKKLPIRTIAFSLAGTLCYLVIYKLLFNVWVPTPVEFKSFKPSMMSMLDNNDFYMANLRYYSFHHKLSFAMLGAALLTNFRNFNWIITLLYLALFTLIYSLLFPINFNPQYDNRYHMGLEIMFVLAPILMIWTTKTTKFTEKYFYLVPTLATLSCFIFLVKYIKAEISPKWALGYNDSLLEPRDAQIHAINMYGVGGQILDRLLPTPWSVAATEMNTFGLFSDRPVIDLWGYTNPEIAKSKICSQRRIRNNPDFFLKRMPDAYWSNTYDLSYHHFAGYSDAKLYYMQSFEKNHYLVGNRYEFFKRYDGFYLLTGHYRTIMYVRKDHSEELIKILTNRQYVLKDTVQFDLAKIKKEFDAEPLVQYNCG